MKILILRTMANVLNLKTYNSQEVGLAKALTRLGHVCDILYYTDKKKDSREIIQFDGDKTITIFWTHGYNIFYEAYYPGLKKMIGNYDLIQVSEYIGINSLWLNARHQEKTVNYQGPYYYPLNKKDIFRAFVLDRLFLPFCHPSRMIIGTKSILATRYIREKHITNVSTLGVGIDTSNIVTSAQGQIHPFLQEIKNKKQSLRYLLYIGKLEPRRNIIFLLDVLSQIVSKDENVRLIVIGKGESEYITECREKASALGILDKIMYCPQFENKFLCEMYRCCDLFLFPTRYEIFGMVLLEAMYFGTPVLTTYNGGSSTLIREGENGFIINQMNPDLWAEKIMEVLNNPALMERVGRKATETVMQSFTWDMLAPRFIELYNKRLKDRNM